MKCCSSCKQSKALTNFSSMKSSKDGLSYTCRQCASTKNKLYRLEHREELLKQKKEWHAANKGHVSEQKKEYYQRTKEKQQAYNRSPKRVLSSKNWKIVNKEKEKVRYTRSRLNKYGLTIEEYQRMLSEQQGACLICGHLQINDNVTFAVDHKHDESRKIRGLLCNDCNLMLGLANDSTETLQKAISYLKERN